METRKAKILAFMQEDAYKPLKLEELVLVLDVPAVDVPIFEKLLEQLLEQGQIIRTKKNRYGATERMGLVAGRFQGNEKGFGFVISEVSGRGDIFVAMDNALGALHNDRVIVRPIAGGGNAKRIEGEIIRVVKRANHTVVGTYEMGQHYGFVVPDDRRLSVDIFIPANETLEARSAQKVVVEILSYPEGRRNPEGRIIEILGNIEDAGTDILAIVRQFHLREVFPKEVLAHAEQYEDAIDEAEILRRQDLRDAVTFTIDGEDAKDLDDAVSLVNLPNGNALLGVHIADVSHYVTENSPLDKEAFERGTSVYLVDRVIPMLPQKLSNGICSLNPNVDRLTLSCEMEIDSTGQVVAHKIFKSVIRSNARMTYTNVTKILEDKDEALMSQYKGLVDTIERMQQLALSLRRKRHDRGSIDFDFPEPKIILDADGKPIEIKKYPVTISNKIIEEFMLCCNETVAEDMFWRTAPFVYRVHEDPNPEKMAHFSELVFNFGYTLKSKGNIQPKQLQQLINKVKGTKEERMISTVMLRSMMKAKYSPNNAGHFGLAAKFYCHFTSPIRRYPDLVIHRIIKEILDGKLTAKRAEALKNFVIDASRQSSETEVIAQEAERSTDDLKKAQFMQDKVGEVFEGIISNITGFGMFVELDNTIEGLVRVSGMEDDYYIFDERHYSLMGEHTKKIYRIGDTVEIRVAKVDLIARKIEFVLEDMGKPRASYRSKALHVKENKPIDKQNKPVKQKDNKKGKNKQQKHSKKR
ncbi:MAG: ribonuclease R [Hyphomonadaceae bacterium]|nr:ribonuclease R [Clostridia bacterium]